MAIIVPLNTISLILSLDFVGSGHREVFKNGNKNQRYFIFGSARFELLVKLQKDLFKRTIIKFCNSHNSNIIFGYNLHNDSKNRFRVC